ncbi:hypothetical protein HYALB_00005409 [Hymenoscyphus albidus]|uniref:Ecp2 effector protein domain-containing protein n=1 Tax=Hymenoscyphus albidus TaxID=595503 RepID=A0A9N9LCC4_9HELO|nr:hypothetical protein HYALB_00005409 [Hymenoscyphus albidus]
MHFLKYVTLFTSAAAATGFTVPEDQADGVYAVVYDNNGEAVLNQLRGPATEIELVESKHRSLARPLTERDIVQQKYDCASPILDLNPGDTDSAVAALERQCNPGAVGKDLDFYSKAGNTVAFFCNFGSAATNCLANEIGDQLFQITLRCGRYRAGWWTMQDKDRWVSLGYDAANSHFCGRH